MAEHEGYIKIDRNMLNWQWFQNVNTAHLFLTLLLKANYKEQKFEGKAIKVGQLVTSLQSLCKTSGLTFQQCRTALKHLKSTGEITSKSYSKYQVITIINFEKYQNLTRLLTINQQATNKQLTSNQQQEKERKKGNREINKKGRSAPDSPDGEKQRRELGREEGTYEDIPMRYRDGTWQSFKTWAEYYDWSHQ